MVKTVRSKWVKLVILKVAQVKKSVGTPGVGPFIPLLTNTSIVNTVQYVKYKMI